MWPEVLLTTIGPILLKKSSLINHYKTYVVDKLKPVWYSKLGHITNLLDFRDYVEDTLLQLQAELDVTQEFTIADLLLKLKSSDRRNECLEFLCSKALDLAPELSLFTKSKPLIAFCLDSELDKYFKASKELTFRPLLKVAPSIIESVVKEIEIIDKLLSIKDLERFQKMLQASSLWSPLALLKANHQGELEDIFLNVPMPKVFGQPNSYIRSELDRKCNFDAIAKPSKKKLDFKKVVLLSGDTIYFYRGL